MNNKKSVLILAIQIGLVASVASAVSAFGAGMLPIPLTLDDAIKYAVESRSEMRIEQTKIQGMEAKVAQAKGAFLPSLDFLMTSERVLNYDQFSGVVVNGTVLGQPINVSVSQTVPTYIQLPTLELEYNLYSGGRDMARLEQAYVNLEGAIASQSIQMRKIAKNVVNTYWGFREAQISYRGALRAAHVAEIAIQIAKVRLMQGKLSELDYKGEEVNVAEKRIESEEAARKLSDRFYAYLDAVGLSSEESTYDPSQVAALRTDPEHTVAFLEQISAQHPEVQKATVEVEAAQKEIKAAQAENYPKLTFFSQYSWVGRDDMSWSNSMDGLHRQAFYVGLRLKANLFDGFKTTNKIAEARSEENRAMIELDRTRLSLRQAKRKNILRLQKAEDDLKLAEERLALGQMKREIAKAKMQTGRESELAFEQMQLEAQNLQDKLLMAKIEVALAKTDLVLAVLD